jgi:hypothetical protein
MMSHRATERTEKNLLWTPPLPPRGVGDTHEKGVLRALCGSVAGFLRDLR